VLGRPIAHSLSPVLHAAAYAALVDFVGRSDTPQLLRIWNYLDAITLGDGDAERYRQFCIGRARGLGDFDTSRLPAAGGCKTGGSGKVGRGDTALVAIRTGPFRAFRRTNSSQSAGGPDFSPWMSFTHPVGVPEAGVS